MTVFDIVLLVEYLISALGSVVYIGRYSFAGWWKSKEGRAIFGQHVALTLLGLLTILFLEFGEEYTGRNLLRLVTVNLLLLSTWSLTFSLFRAQKRAKLARSAGQDQRDITQNGRNVEQNQRESDQNERDRA